MLDFLVIVFVVLISVFLIYSICLFLAHCNEKKELDLDWHISECNLKDNFRAFEGYITSDVYTYHKIKSLSDRFNIGNVYFEKEVVDDEKYHGSHVSPTTGDTSYFYSYDRHITIKSYVKHKDCVYDNGEVTVKLLKGQRLIMLWSDNDDLLNYILDNFENIVEEK